MVYLDSKLYLRTNSVLLVLRAVEGRTRDEAKLDIWSQSVETT